MIEIKSYYEKFIFTWVTILIISIVSLYVFYTNFSKPSSESLFTKTTIDSIKNKIDPVKNIILNDYKIYLLNYNKSHNDIETTINKTKEMITILQGFKFDVNHYFEQLKIANLTKAIYNKEKKQIDVYSNYDMELLLTTDYKVISTINSIQIFQITGLDDIFKKDKSLKDIINNNDSISQLSIISIYKNLSEKEQKRISKLLISLNISNTLKLNMKKYYELKNNLEKIKNKKHNQVINSISKLLDKTNKLYRQFYEKKLKGNNQFTQLLEIIFRFTILSILTSSIIISILQIKKILTIKLNFETYNILNKNIDITNDNNVINNERIINQSIKMSSENKNHKNLLNNSIYEKLIEKMQFDKKE